MRKTMTAALAASSLVLATCGPQQGGDGYAFERKEFERSTVVVAVVQHADLSKLRSEAARRGVRAERRDLQAFSIITGDRCEVHVVDPAQHYSPQWLGHEVAHCLYGRWHA